MNNNGSKKLMSMFMVSLMVLAIFVSLPVSLVSGAVITLSFSDGVDSRTVTAGSSVVYSIKITNGESAARTVNMTLSGVPQDWTAVFSGGANFDIDGYSSVTKSLQVYAPSNATAETRATIVITANHKIKSDGGSPGSESITSVTLVKQTYGITTSTTTISKDIAPGGSANFDLKVTNTGNGIDTVNLTVTTKPSGWSISPASSQNINPGLFAAVPVPCFVPSDAIAGQYSFSIRATSENPSYYSEQTFVVNVTAKYGLSLQATETVKYVDPGKTVIYPFNVTNTGNKIDSFNVVITLNKAGWFGNPNPNPLSNINPSASKSFTVIITAPNTASYNDQVTCNLTVTSQGDITKVQTTSIVAIVNKLHNVDINPSSFNLNVQPGGVITSLVQITNNGNGEDTFKLDILNAPSTLTINYDQSQITIPKGATRNVNITVTAVTNAASGNNKVGLRAYASDDITKFDIANVTITVTQSYDILVQASGANTKHAAPGGSVSFNLTVKNKGNGKDTVFMSATGAPVDWNFYFTPASINDLAASEVANVMFTVELPDDASPGSKPIVIMGTSDGNGTVNSTVTVTVIADIYYQVEMTTPGPYNTTKPNQTAGYIMTVRNKGSGSDTFLMTATGSNPSWVSFNTSSVSLGPGASVPVKVTVSVPPNTAMGNVTQTITATSSGDSTVKTSVQITTQILQQYLVQLTASPTTKAIKPGMAGTILIYLKNTGNGNDQFYVSLDKNPNLWGELDLASPYVSLTSNQIITFNLTVTVPADAQSMDLNYTIKAISQNDNLVIGLVTAVAAIDPIYGVTMSGIILSNEAEPTEKVQYQLKVKNTGNKQDSFQLDLLGSYRAWASLTSSVITLASNSDQRVYINVTVPDDKEPGSYVIQVKVSSKGDDAKSDYQNLTVEVVKKHDIKLVSASDTLQTGDPSDILTFKVDVTNLGGSKDTVDLVVTGAHPTWGKLSQYQIVDLGANQTKQITMTVTLPGNARPESFVIAVKATEETKGRSQTLNLTVVVNQIYAFEITSPMTEQSISPGGSVNYILNITNRGTGADTFMLAAQNYTDWITFNETSILLAENMTGSVKVMVTIPSLPLPDTGDHKLNIKVSSVGDSAVFKNQDFKLSVSQIYAVKVTSNVTVAFVDPGQSAKYTLTIENKGNGKDTFVISKTGTNPSWLSINPVSVTIDQGTTTQVAITIQVPQSATKQTLTNTLTVTSQGLTTKNSTVVLTTNVNLVYGVEVSPNSRTKTLNTPTTYSFAMTVKNKGSGNDTFLVEAVGENKEWIKFNITSFLLAPDGQRSVNVNVTIPFETPYDELNGTYIWAIKVTSQGFSFKYAELALTVTVDIRYGFSQAWDKTTLAAGPGELVDCNVSINNKGNIQDSYILTPLGSYASWISFNTQSSPGATYTFNLSKQNNKKIRAYVKVPLSQPNADYKIQVEIKSLGNDSLTITQDLKVTVSEVFNVELTADENNLDIGPGATVQFKVKVKNTGNVFEEFELTIDKASGTYYKWADAPTPNIFNQSKDAYTWVLVNVTAPLDQTKGTYTVRLKASVTNAKSTTTATLDLKVVISFAVEITAMSAERQKEVTPGNKMYFNFTLKNKGTGDDTYSLKVDDSIFTDKDIAKWATFTKTEVPVKYEGEVKTTLIITVPVDAEKKDYTFRVRATSSYDDLTYTNYDFTLSVKGISGVTLNTENDIPKGEPGNSVQYTVKIKNTGNQADNFAITAENAYKSWVSFDRTTISIGYDTTVNLLVTIKIPDDAKTASYNVTIKAKSNTDEEITATMKLQVDVRQMVDFTVTTDDSSKSSDPGKNITYKLTIENLGNGDDSYKFEVSSSDSTKKEWVTFETDDLAVAYDNKEDTRVYVNIPADYKDAVAGPFDLTVKVISRENDTIYKTLKLTTTINQLYNVVLSCSDTEQTLQINGDDAEWEIDVKNSGNGDDQVTFQIDSKDASWQKAWWSFSPTSIDVESLKTRTTTLKLYSSRLVDVAAGDYNFRIVAVSGDGDTKSPTLSLKVKVTSAEIQIVSWNIKSTSISAGDKVSVEVVIKNIGEAATPSTFSVALLLDNSPVVTTSTSKLNANEETTLTLNWEPESATSGSLKVRATIAGEKYDSSAKSVTVKGSAGFGGLDMSNPMFLIAIVLIVVVILLVVIMVATRRKPTPTPMMPPPLPPSEESTEEEEEAPSEEGSEEGAPEEEAPPSEEGSEEDVPSEESEAPAARVAKIRCPKCKEIMEISSSKRPLEVRCSSCNAKLLLKK